MTKHNEATFNEVAAQMGYKGVPCGIEAFDLWHNEQGKYVGCVVNSPRGWKFYYNMNATKGSKRLFATVQDLLAFIHQRRVQRGWIAA